MTRKRRPKGDPIEQEIELALNPGAFIPYGASFSFVSELDEVAAKIAKRCFERAGQQDEWSKTVRQIRADHHRKRSFMPGFERLVDGMGPSDEPSFLELAKARWSAKERRTR